MKTIWQIAKTQLTDKEILIYLLAESGMSYREIGDRTVIDHTQVARIAERARQKLAKFEAK